MSGPGNRRLQKELMSIQKSAPENKLYRFIDPEDTEKNILEWKMLLTPQSVPYSKGAFKIIITFPTEYPFKPPKILFKTRIYHPNIDEKGQICLPIISPENWKPATKADQVLRALSDILKSPQADHPLRGDVAEEYTKDRSKFNKVAEEQTKKYSEKRPSDCR